MCRLFPGYDNCAQKPKPATEFSQGCDLRVFGEKNTARLLTFDSDLRQAIATRDVGRLALLVLFPLRISDGRGGYYIHDIRALDGHFDQIFPPETRRALAAMDKDAIECSYTGIRYGDKPLLWVDVIDRGFFLAGVDHFDMGRAAWDASVHDNFSCVNAEWRVLIERAAGQKLTYRSWKPERSLYAKPDREIVGGEESVEGTGPCSHRVWKFQQGEMSVRVEEPGCYGDNDGPPQGSTARLGIKTAEQVEEKFSWCY